METKRETFDKRIPYELVIFTHPKDRYSAEILERLDTITTAYPQLYECYVVMDTSILKAPAAAYHVEHTPCAVLIDDLTEEIWRKDGILELDIGFLIRTLRMVKQGRGRYFALLKEEDERYEKACV